MGRATLCISQRDLNCRQVDSIEVLLLTWISHVAVAEPCWLIHADELGRQWPQMRGSQSLTSSIELGIKGAKAGNNSWQFVMHPSTLHVQRPTKVVTCILALLRWEMACYAESAPSEMKLRGKPQLCPGFEPRTCAW